MKRRMVIDGKGLVVSSCDECPFLRADPGGYAELICTYPNTTAKSIIGGRSDSLEADFLDGCPLKEAQ